MPSTKNLRSGSRGRLFLVNGYPLAVEAAVAGAPLILLHGALSDYRNWQPQIAEFSVGRGRIDQWSGSAATLNLLLCQAEL
jgi:pimeloyl-ACP methyl ester carboxylesterase